MINQIILHKELGRCAFELNSLSVTALFCVISRGRGIVFVIPYGQINVIDKCVFAVCFFIYIP